MKPVCRKALQSVNSLLINEAKKKHIIEIATVKATEQTINRSLNRCITSTPRGQS